MNNQQTTGPGRSAARTGQAPASVRTPPTSLPFPRRASWARLRAGPAAARARTRRGYRNCPALPDSARLTGQHRTLTRATPTALRRPAAPWSAALPIGWPPAPTSATPPFPAHLPIPFLDSLLIPFLDSLLIPFLDSLLIPHARRRSGARAGQTTIPTPATQSGPAIPGMPRGTLGFAASPS